MEPRPARRQTGRNTQRLKEENKRGGGAAPAGPGRVPAARGEAQRAAWPQPRGRKVEAADRQGAASVAGGAPRRGQDLGCGGRWTEGGVMGRKGSRMGTRKRRTGEH